MDQLEVLDLGVDQTERREVERVVNQWCGPTAVEAVERLGGLTNHTFKVVAGEVVVAVRLPGAGTATYIDRHAELRNAEVAASLDIGPRILHEGEGALVSAFVEGRVLSPEALRDEPATLKRAGGLLRRLHNCARTFKGCFDPVTTIAAHRAALQKVPAGTDELIERVQGLAPPVRLTPCHNDPWPENFIDSGDELHLLDWEYSAMGDPAWDLADLAVEAGLDRRRIERLLVAYSGGEVPAQLRSRVEQLAPVTDVLWGLWALVRERDANPADDFATYGRQRLDRAARSLRATPHRSSPTW